MTQGMGSERRGVAGQRTVLLWAGPSARHRLVTLLQSAGHHATLLQPGERLDRAADRLRPDAAVLDLDASRAGAVLHAARALGYAGHTPFVVVGTSLTATDRMAAYDAGADDVFDLAGVAEELQARLAVVLRHAGTSAGVERFEDIHLDVAAHAITRAGEPVDLTSIEFAILATLLRHRGRVVAKEHLMRTVWGHEDVSPNSVEVHISALRRKLELLGPRVVHTVRGQGYVVRRVHPSQQAAS